MEKKRRTKYRDTKDPGKRRKKRGNDKRKEKKKISVLLERLDKGVWKQGPGGRRKWDAVKVLEVY